ncbi:MAG: N,N-dimethylformamidase beta subunit family domain-containing protein, partial [Hyphomicrobium sp.]
MTKFFEHQTDIDTHTGDGRLLSHKALISAGHNEYWTDAMRNNVEKARDKGLSLGFFGANAVYWQI